MPQPILNFAKNYIVFWIQYSTICAWIDDFVCNALFCACKGRQHRSDWVERPPLWKVTYKHLMVSITFFFGWSTNKMSSFHYIFLAPVSADNKENQYVFSLFLWICLYFSQKIILCFRWFRTFGRFALLSVSPMHETRDTPVIH